MLIKISHMNICNSSLDKANPIGRYLRLTDKVATTIYLPATTSKAYSAGSEDKNGSNCLNELFEWRIAFDNIGYTRVETQRRRRK